MELVAAFHASHPPPFALLPAGPSVIVVAAIKAGGNSQFTQSLFSPLRSTCPIHPLSLPYQQLLALSPSIPYVPVLHAPMPVALVTPETSTSHTLIPSVLASLKAGEGSAYVAATNAQLDKIRNIVGPLFTNYLR